jgi:hypothetical protein
MDGWHVALVSVAVPALITAGLPYISAWGKRRHERHLSYYDIGFRMRDELRADNENLRARVEILEVENGKLRGGLSVAHTRITRLEDVLRRRAPDELEGIG